MVYNIVQYKLRQALKENDDTLPNQLKKEVQNPTIVGFFRLWKELA